MATTVFPGTHTFGFVPASAQVLNADGTAATTYTSDGSTTAAPAISGSTVTFYAPAGSYRLVVKHANTTDEERVNVQLRAAPLGTVADAGALAQLEASLRADFAVTEASAVSAQHATDNATYQTLTSASLSNAANLSASFAGVLATLRRGYRSVCIGLVGDSTGDGYYPPGQQTLGDEWPQVLVKKIAAAYPGYTLQERRWNDTNQGYDPIITWQTGTINGGAERYALFSKTTPGGLQYTGTAVTTDLDIQVRIAPTTWTPTGDQAIAAKWESVGNQRSFLFLLKTTGALGLNWSTAGTAGFGEKDSTATIPATANPGNGNPLWVRATLKLDNGASGNDVKFYYSTDGTTWTQLGTTVTTAGTTTLFGGTAPYTLGSFTVGLSSPFDGKIMKARVFGAIGGQQSLVPPLPDDWDWYSAETTVSLGGAPVIMLLNGSQSGQNVAYFDNATRRPIIHQPFGQQVVMVNTSHNDGTQSRNVWLAAYKTMLTNIQTLLPYTPILCLGQNPVGVGGAFSITQQGLELRSTRGAAIQQLAASMTGVYAFDAWPLLTTADLYDQLHPTAGDGSGNTGAEKWGNGMFNRFKTQS